MHGVPIRDSYWVEPGKLLAGEYPGATDAERARERVDLFESHGVTLFLDLTHPADGLEPYERHLRRARRHAVVIPDLGVTTRPRYVEALDAIDAEIAAGGIPYVHCWGGIGRTGTVVGCWLVRHSLDAGDPIGRIAELRRRVLDSFMPSPQTTAQREVVLGWKPGR